MGWENRAKKASHYPLYAELGLSKLSQSRESIKLKNMYAIGQLIIINNMKTEHSHRT